MRDFHTLRFCVVAITACVLLAAAGCGDDDGGAQRACVAGTTEGCAPGLYCEPVTGSEPACFAPIELRGRVFDALDDTGIPDATVVALGPNGEARSDIAITGVDGTYALPVSVTRNPDGTAASSESITLRVDASGYQTFPTPPRTALPIEISPATVVDDAGTGFVMNAATDVALLPLPGGDAGLAEIDGTVDADDPGGVLVVAEQGGRAVSTAVSDASGDFVLFNVPPGATTVTGYRVDLVVEPRDVDLPAGGLRDIVLATHIDGLATVSGSVEIVNAPGGATTSVILVVESTFEPNAARGQAPAGLRAFPVGGGFTIEGVPPGRYVVLAAFENDDLVRDPDTNIGGTDIVHLEVPEGGGQVDISEGFKVTGALGVVSPGADTIETVGATPTFTWADDSSEDGYDLRVFDAFGNMTYEALGLPRVTGSDTVTHTYAGPALTPGMVYQFRVLSWRERGGRTPISTTEDLRGVFTVGL